LLRSRSADQACVRAVSATDDFEHIFDSTSSVEQNFHYPGSPDWMSPDQASSCSTTGAKPDLHEDPSGSPDAIVPNTPESNTSKARQVLEAFVEDYWQAYTTGCQIHQMLHQLDSGGEEPEVIDCCPVSWQPQPLNKEPSALPKSHATSVALAVVARETHRLQQQDERVEEAKSQYYRMVAVLDSHLVSRSSGID